MPERLRIRCIIAVQLARSGPALPRSMGVFLGGLGTLRPPTRSLQGRHTEPRPGGARIQLQHVSLPAGSSSGTGQPWFGLISGQSSYRGGLLLTVIGKC